MAVPPSAAGSRTQRERSDATIALLLSVARDIFARDGYAATSLTTVVEVAGVTKGALYHHFESKQDLFLAVYEAEGRRLTVLVAQAYRAQSDPLEAFHAGIATFLEALLDPDVQRIMLIDAPGALGMQTFWDELSHGGSIGQIRRGLEVAAQAGAIPTQSVEALAHLIYGAVCAAAQLIAHSEDQRAMLGEVLTNLRLMLDAVAGRTTTVA